MVNITFLVSDFVSGVSVRWHEVPRIGDEVVLRWLGEDPHRVTRVVWWEYVEDPQVTIYLDPKPTDRPS